MTITKEFFDDFIKRLHYHNRGEGVNDHCTASPIFIVQKKEIVTGIDLEHDPLYFWVDDDGSELSDEELMEALAELKAEGEYYDEFDIEVDTEVTNGEHTFYRKIGYVERWEYVCAHFTKEAAERFVAQKKHDYRELRVYVEAQVRCWEFNDIIQGLLDGQIGFIEPKDEVTA